MLWLVLVAIVLVGAMLAWVMHTPLERLNKRMVERIETTRSALLADPPASRRGKS